MCQWRWSKKRFTSNWTLPPSVLLVWAVFEPGDALPSNQLIGLMWTQSVSKPKQTPADRCWCSPTLSVLQLTAGETKQIYCMSEVLTKSWGGIAAWVIEKYNIHVKTFQRTHVTKTRWAMWKFFKLKEDITGMHRENIFLCVPACGPVRRWTEWTSGWRSAQRSVESRISYCCFHRSLAAVEDADSPDGQKIPMLTSYHTISQTSTDPPKRSVLEAVSDNRTGH